VYQVKSSGCALVGTYECMTCKAASLPFFIFHRGGVLFFVIDIMVTVVFEVSRTSCVVVGTFRLAVCYNTLAIQHTGLGSLDVRNPLLEVAAVKSSGQWTKGIRRPRRSENHDRECGFACVLNISTPYVDFNGSPPQSKRSNRMGARSPGLDSGTAEREYPLSGGE
jgi:hypothetical protein